MNDTKIASKTKAQLAHFMGKVFTHFSKPSKKFVEECIYGIQAPAPSWSATAGIRYSRPTRRESGASMRAASAAGFLSITEWCRRRSSDVLPADATAQMISMQSP